MHFNVQFYFVEVGTGVGIGGDRNGLGFEIFLQVKSYKILSSICVNTAFKNQTAGLLQMLEQEVPSRFLVFILLCQKCLITKTVRYKMKLQSHVHTEDLLIMHG